MQESLIGQLEKDEAVEHVKAQPQPASLKQEQTETIVELPKTIQEVQTAPSVVEEPAIITVEEPTDISVKEQAVGVAGKLKGLFGKSKQESILAKPELVVTEQQEESQPAPSSQTQPAVNLAKGRLGKLKNLFGAKQQPEAMKEEGPEIQPSTASPEKDRYGKSKYYFGDIAQQPEDEKPDEPEIHSAPLETKQPSESAAKAQLGKLKNLLGAKKQAEELKPDAVAIQPVSSGMKQPTESAGKDRLGKLKNLLGAKIRPEETKPEVSEIQHGPTGTEEPQVAPAKGQFGKLKNLFGKNK